MLPRCPMTIARLFRSFASASSLDSVSSSFRRESLFLALAFIFSTQIAINTYSQTPDTKNFIEIDNTARSASADRGESQVVNTVHGPLSFAQIQKHPQRVDILKVLRKEDRGLKLQFDEWETKAAINEGVQLDKQTIFVLRRLVDVGKKIELRYKPIIEKYATTPPPDANALYLLEKDKQSSIFAQ
jgi:hypothetical protein